MHPPRHLASHPSLRPLVPMTTPMVIDARQPRVLLKLEGLGPSGHVTDRVALEVLEELADEPARELVRPALDLLTVSLAQLAVPRGYKVTAFHADTRSEKRLVGLARVVGCTLVRSEQPAADARVHAEREDATLVDPTRAARAGRALARELCEQAPARVVAVVISESAAPLADGLRRVCDGARVETVATPTKGSEILADTATSLGRQGVLAGPPAAAVVAEARRLAEEHEDGIVIALLPDSGQRHLGWWPTGTEHTRKPTGAPAIQSECRER